MIIVIFHALYLFGKYVYENFNNRKEKTEDTMVANQLLNVSEADYENSTETEDFSDNVKIKFFPPVYVQRYNTVQSVLTSGRYHGKIQKVIDFGCAELSFAIHLKNTDGIKEIYCIDVDRSLLEHTQTKVAPLHCDYLSLRTEPLTIHVCEGSIAHNDNQLANTDAVICIELIEHLYPDDLEAFPYNVFGFIRPQVAIVTTPNSDFNVLFRLNGFRHADHKFEWTRAQFQDWATNIVSRYPDYEVSFHGIGAGPEGTEHLGSCSQMAVFHRHIQLQDESPEGVDGLLKTVVSYKYPYRADNRSDEEKILAEAEYYIRLFSGRDEELSEEIPLEKLMFSVEKFRISTEILRIVLEEANWSIAERENGPVVIVPPQSTFSVHSDADLDDFLDNDYRHHGDDDDWDVLEPGAPRSAYFFDSYMEQDPQNDQEEENWDDEEPHTRHSSNQNLNSENLPNSELHVSENVDHTLDSQWTVEDLNNDGRLLAASQHQPFNGLGTQTELPSDSFSIGLDSTDINCLNIPNDTLNSSEDTSAPLLSICHLSETSHSPIEVDVHLPPSNRAILLSHDEVDCCAAHNETSFIPTAEAMCLLSHEQHLLVANEEFLNNGREVLKQSIDSVAQGCSTSLLYNDRSVSENYDHDDLCSIYLQPSTTSNNFSHPDNEISHLSIKDLSSATNESSSNLDDSHDSRNSSYQKCQTDLINTQYIESERIESQDSMSLQSISNSSLDLKPKYTSSPQIVPDIHKIQAQSDNKGQRLLDTPSLQYSQTIRSLNIKDTDPEDTYRTNIKKEPREVQKLHSSVLKMNLLCTNNALTREMDTPHKESSLKGKMIDENNALRNRPESNMVKNISPSPSQLSLQSNSDISLSTATSTGSSNVDKWYAAEVNPMYQQGLVVLKGGNDKSDNPEEETTSAHNLSLDRPDLPSDSRPTGFPKQIRNDDFTTSDILGTSTGGKNQSQCKSIPNNEISTLYNVGKIAKERGQLKYEFDHARGLENSDQSKPFSPESLDTPPNSWSPEIMDSGYPNSASVHDVTPEYDLSSIANDRISDSDSASVGEVPVPGFYEFVEVENGDLANNNRDDEGNNVIAFQANDIDDLQPLIDVLENDMENENDIYVLQNGFPLWLLRILEMANPIDLEGVGGPQAQLYPAPLEQAGGDAPNLNADNDEGFDSSSSSDDDSDIEDDEADDATTVSSDETEDHSTENLRTDWRAGGDP